MECTSSQISSTCGRFTLLLVSSQLPSSDPYRNCTRHSWNYAFDHDAHSRDARKRSLRRLFYIIMIPIFIFKCRPKSTRCNKMQVRSNKYPSFVFTERQRRARPPGIFTRKANTIMVRKCLRIRNVDFPTSQNIVCL